MPWLHKSKKSTKAEPAQQQQQQQQPQESQPQPQQSSQNIEHALRGVLEALRLDKQSKPHCPSGGDGTAVNLLERVLQSAGTNTDAQPSAPLRPPRIPPHQQRQDPDDYSNALKCIQQYLERAASRTQSPRQQQQNSGATVSATSATAVRQTTSTFTSDLLDPPSSASRLRRRKGRPHQRELMPPEADLISGLTSEDVQESEESKGKDTVKDRNPIPDAEVRGQRRRLPPQRQAIIQFTSAPSEASMKAQRARPFCQSPQHPSAQPPVVHAFSCSVVSGCWCVPHDNRPTHACAVLLLTQADRPHPPPLSMANESLTEEAEPETETVTINGEVNEEEEKIKCKPNDEVEDEAQQEAGVEAAEKQDAEEYTESSGTNGNASPAPSDPQRTLDTYCGGDSLETNTCADDTAAANATGKGYPDDVVFVGANGNNFAADSYRYPLQWSPPLPPPAPAPLMHSGLVESRLPIECACEASLSIDPVAPLHAGSSGPYEAEAANKGQAQLNKVVQLPPVPQRLAQPLALEDGLMEDGRSSPHSVTTLEVMDKNRANDVRSDDGSVANDDCCNDHVGCGACECRRRAPGASAAGDTAAAIPATINAAPLSACSCDISKSSGFTRLLETLDKAHRRRESRRPVSPTPPPPPGPAVCAAAGDMVVAEPEKGGLKELTQTQRNGYLGYLNRQRASVQTLNQMLLRSPFVSSGRPKLSPSQSPQPSDSPPALSKAPRQQEQRQPQPQRQPQALAHRRLSVIFQGAAQENKNQQLPAQNEPSQPPAALPNDVIVTTATSLMCLSQSLQQCVLQIEDTVHKLSGSLKE